MTNILKLFGERVKEIRKAQGLSQEDLAERANLHNTYIGGVERGERNLSLKSIEKIALALKTSVNVFFENKSKLAVSEDLESEPYLSNEKNPSRVYDRELQECINSIKSDEFKNSILRMLKIASKMK